MHDAITLGVPVLAILFGILLNQKGLSDLRSEVKMDIARLESKIDRLEIKVDRLQSDLTQFSRELGRHDARLDNLDSKRA
jgi:outer membrane murein-binding lipoprotein Lpp